MADAWPIDISPLIGRAPDLAAVQRRLESGRLVTITGLGGSGKTRLAREIGSIWAKRAESAHFVDLSGATERIEAASRIAAAIDARETAELDAEQAIVGIVGGDDERLLILDNLEQLEGAPGLILRLLTDAPALRILGTSRIRLGIAGEGEVPLGPLDLPEADTPDGIAASAAGALFLARARGIGRLDELSIAEAQEIASLLRRLDGLPLALELAAARMRVMSPGSVVRRLEAQAGALDDQAAAEHRSLTTVLAWTIGLLDDETRRLLVALSVCVGGFDLLLAEALAPDIDSLAGVDRLVSLGLVKVEPEVDGERRFRILETVRAAAQRLLEPDQLEIVERRRADRMLALAQEYQHLRFIASSARILNRVKADEENVHAALAWATTASPDVGLETVYSLRLYWEDVGGLRLAADRIRRLLEVDLSPRRARAAGLAAAAFVERNLGAPVHAAALAEEGAVLARSVGYGAVENTCLTILAIGAAATGEIDRVEQISERLLELGVQENDTKARANAYWSMGLAAALRNDAIALDHLRRATAADRERGDLGGAAEDLALLSQVALMLGQPAIALEAAAEAVELQRSVAVGGTSIWGLSLVMAAAVRLGQQQVARSALDECVELALARKETVDITAVLRFSMAVAVYRGDYDLGARLWGACEGLQDVMGEQIELIDRWTSEQDLAEVRRELHPVKFELAMRIGRTQDVVTLFDEVRALLEPSTETRRLTEGQRLRHGDLTTREVEVLALVAEGRSDAEIADALFISPKTASVHVSNAKAKLGATSRLDLALRARDLLGDP